MLALGLSAAIWRGREADHPDDVDKPGGERRRVCLNLTAAREAENHGEDVEKAVCGKPGEACRVFRLTCMYHQQKIAVVGADIVVAAHQLAFRTLPRAIRENLSLTVLDESW